MIKIGTQKVTPKQAALEIEKRQRFGYVSIKMVFPEATARERILINEQQWKLRRNQCENK